MRNQNGVGIRAGNSGSVVSHLAGLHALNLALISTKQQSGPRNLLSSGNAGTLEQQFRNMQKWARQSTLLNRESNIDKIQTRARDLDKGTKNHPKLRLDKLRNNRVRQEMLRSFYELKGDNAESKRSKRKSDRRLLATDMTGSTCSSAVNYKTKTTEVKLISAQQAQLCSIVMNKRNSTNDNFELKISPFKQSTFTISILPTGNLTFKNNTGAVIDFNMANKIPPIEVLGNQITVKFDGYNVTAVKNYNQWNVGFYTSANFTAIDPTCIFKESIQVIPASQKITSSTTLGATSSITLGGISSTILGATSSTTQAVTTSASIQIPQTSYQKICNSTENGLVTKEFALVNGQVNSSLPARFVSEFKSDNKTYFNYSFDSFKIEVKDGSLKFLNISNSQPLLSFDSQGNNNTAFNGYELKLTQNTSTSKKYQVRNNLGEIIDLEFSFISGSLNNIKILDQHKDGYLLNITGSSLAQAKIVTNAIINNTVSATCQAIDHLVDPQIKVPASSIPDVNTSNSSLVFSSSSPFDPLTSSTYISFSSSDLGSTPSVIKPNVTISKEGDNKLILSIDSKQTASVQFNQREESKDFKFNLTINNQTIELSIPQSLAIEDQIQSLNQQISRSSLSSLNFTNSNGNISLSFTTPNQEDVNLIINKNPNNNKFNLAFYKDANPLDNFQGITEQDFILAESLYQCSANTNKALNKSEVIVSTKENTRISSYVIPSRNDQSSHYNVSLVIEGRRSTTISISIDPVSKSVKITNSSGHEIPNPGISVLGGLYPIRKDLNLSISVVDGLYSCAYVDSRNLKIDAQCLTAENSFPPKPNSCKIHSSGFVIGNELAIDFNLINNSVYVKDFDAFLSSKDGKISLIKGDGGVLFTFNNSGLQQSSLGGNLTGNGSNYKLLDNQGNQLSLLFLVNNNQPSLKLLKANGDGVQYNLTRDANLETYNITGIVANQVITECSVSQFVNLPTTSATSAQVTTSTTTAQETTTTAQETTSTTSAQATSAIAATTSALAIDAATSALAIDANTSATATNISARSTTAQPRQIQTICNQTITDQHVQQNFYNDGNLFFSINASRNASAGDYFTTPISFTIGERKIDFRFRPSQTIQAIASFFKRQFELLECVVETKLNPSNPNQTIINLLNINPANTSLIITKNSGNITYQLAVNGTIINQCNLLTTNIVEQVPEIIPTTSLTSFSTPIVILPPLSSIAYTTFTPKTNNSCEARNNKVVQRTNGEDQFEVSKKDDSIEFKFLKSNNTLSFDNSTLRVDGLQQLFPYNFTDNNFTYTATNASNNLKIIRNDGLEISINETGVVVSSDRGYIDAQICNFENIKDKTSTITIFDTTTSEIKTSTTSNGITTTTSQNISKNQTAPQVTTSGTIIQTNSEEQRSVNIAKAIVYSLVGTIGLFIMGYGVRKYYKKSRSQASISPSNNGQLVFADGVLGRRFGGVDPEFGLSRRERGFSLGSLLTTLSGLNCFCGGDAFHVTKQDSDLHGNILQTKNLFSLSLIPSQITSQGLDQGVLQDITRSDSAPNFAPKGGFKFENDRFKFEFDQISKNFILKDSSGNIKARCDESGKIIDPAIDAVAKNPKFKLSKFGNMNVRYSRDDGNKKMTMLDENKNGFQITFIGENILSSVVEEGRILSENFNGIYIEHLSNKAKDFTFQDQKVLKTIILDDKFVIENNFGSAIEFPFNNERTGFDLANLAEVINTFNENNEDGFEFTPPTPESPNKIAFKIDGQDFYILVDQETKQFSFYDSRDNKLESSSNKIIADEQSLISITQDKADFEIAFDKNDVSIYSLINSLITSSNNQDFSTRITMVSSDKLDVEEGYNLSLKIINKFLDSITELSRPDETISYYVESMKSILNNDRNSNNNISMILQTFANMNAYLKDNEFNLASLFDKTQQFFIEKNHAEILRQNQQHSLQELISIQMQEAFSTHLALQPLALQPLEVSSDLASSAKDKEQIDSKRKYVSVAESRLVIQKNERKFSNSATVNDLEYSQYSDTEYSSEEDFDSSEEDLLSDDEFEDEISDEEFLDLQEETLAEEEGKYRSYLQAFLLNDKNPLITSSIIEERKKQLAELENKIPDLISKIERLDLLRKQKIEFICQKPTYAEAIFWKDELYKSCIKILEINRLQDKLISQFNIIADSVLQENSQNLFVPIAKNHIKIFQAQKDEDNKNDLLIEVSSLIQQDKWKALAAKTIKSNERRLDFAVISKKYTNKIEADMKEPNAKMQLIKDMPSAPLSKNQKDYNLQ